jgi:hypothetical protein
VVLSEKISWKIILGRMLTSSMVAQASGARGRERVFGCSEFIITFVNYN